MKHLNACPYCGGVMAYTKPVGRFTGYYMETSCIKCRSQGPKLSFCEKIWIKDDQERMDIITERCNQRIYTAKSDNEYVLQPWMSTLSFKMQSVILSSFRGCDGRPKDDPTKYIIRYLRVHCLRCADKTTNYMDCSPLLVEESIGVFLNNLDGYPVHFVLHLTHSAQIIGYLHSDTKVKQTSLDLYTSICKAFHMNFESKSEMTLRLADKKDN